jgi:3-hydroxyacyl-CoA dehydrogenase
LTIKEFPMLSQHDGIAVITLENPPVNTLSHELRSWIMSEIEAADADPAVRGIVLAGNEKAFCAGAEVTEFGTPKQLREPIVPSILAWIENCRKPVVAAIGGIALGGGLELALACHARVALATAKLGLPEINLGLIPGSGGTQRLPRLIGLAAALAMIQGGQAQSARQLAASGLIDAVVEVDVFTAAIQKAIELADLGMLPRARDRQLDGSATQALIEAARNKLTTRQRLQPAYAAQLDALAATVLPIDEGLRRERAIFLNLVPTSAAQALRYQFKAERIASKLPPSLDAEPRVVQTIAVIGAGTMGAGIAICVLDAGLDVLLFEQDELSLQRGSQRIADHYQSRVAAGKLNASVAASAMTRLQPTVDWTKLRQADLVIEAVFEDMDIKRAIFKKIDQHARSGAVLATNTSYLDIDAISQATMRPKEFLGLHFFSPANVMKLLEVVRGAQSDATVLATGMALGRKLGKLPVLAGNAFGFIGNRIYNAYRKQCEFMLEDGALPEDVDNALTGMGFAMGPFAVADLSGLDIAWRMRQSQAAARDPRERYVAILDRLCEQGRLGRKAGAGYYTYADGKQSKTTDYVVRQIIEQASAQRGLERKSLSSEEICRRALLAMVNEAALLLSEGIATRPSDIDVVLVQGYGFPRWAGGPVFWARQQARAQLDAGLDGLIADSGFCAKRADAQMLDAILAG